MLLLKGIGIGRKRGGERRSGCVLLDVGRGGQVEKFRNIGYWVQERKTG